jgi:hypothetical protein
MYELELMMYREYGVQSANYVPCVQVYDDRSIPDELLPTNLGERDALISVWQTKRAMVEGVGGKFEVRPKTQDVNNTPSSRSLFGRHPVFGRKT